MEIQGFCDRTSTLSRQLGSVDLVATKPQMICRSFCRKKVLDGGWAVLTVGVPNGQLLQTSPSCQRPPFSCGHMMLALIEWPYQRAGAGVGALIGSIIL